MIKYVFFALLTSWTALCQSETLFVGSFNIQSLGPTKISRPEFVSIVVKVLAKYDIVLIQEIKDVKLTTLPKLVTELNNYVKDRGIVYGYKISPRLGSTAYKEQYAFLYQIVAENNNRKITVTNDYVYNDVLGVYERPPYVAKFQISDSTVSIRDFYVLNVHLRPQNVFLESLELRNVVDEILLEDSNHNIAVLGDFNFDCDYISEKNRNIVRAKLFEFDWYISDKVETTVGQASCALDRIILTGQTFKKSVISKSNQTYYYNQEYGLSLNETLKISDHYPVEIKLK